MLQKFEGVVCFPEIWERGLVTPLQPTAITSSACGTSAWWEKRTKTIHKSLNEGEHSRAVAEISPGKWRANDQISDGGSSECVPLKFIFQVNVFHVRPPPRCLIRTLRVFCFVFPLAVLQRPGTEWEGPEDVRGCLFPDDHLQRGRLSFHAPPLLFITYSVFLVPAVNWYKWTWNAFPAGGRGTKGAVLTLPSAWTDDTGVLKNYILRLRLHWKNTLMWIHSVSGESFKLEYQSAYISVRV